MRLQTIISLSGFVRMAWFLAGISIASAAFMLNDGQTQEFYERLWVTAGSVVFALLLDGLMLLKAAPRLRSGSREDKAPLSPDANLG